MLASSGEEPWWLKGAEVGPGAGTSVLQPASHPPRNINHGAERSVSQQRVRSPGACVAPALAGRQGCLFLADVSTLANYFYFGMEIIL